MDSIAAAPRPSDGIPRNIPLFIAFRVLFNTRFYYPVLGILFLDLGLSLEQYALLNVVWAATIISLEVPSGALADLIGRRRLVVAAAALMVVEMLLFAFAPTGNATLLFWLLVLNRVASGAAEAAASGADEALAYDSLPAADRETRWPRVLEILVRWQSGVFFFAMITGALLYDAAFLNSLLGPFNLTLSPEQTVRWPVFATLIPAVACLATALALREPPVPLKANPSPTSAAANVAAAWTNIRTAAAFVLGERRILLVLLAALVADSVVRLFLTFESNYLRLIQLPEAVFGLIGAGMALLGFIAAPIARRMVAAPRHAGAGKNFGALGIIIFVGLVGTALPIRFWGIWVIVPLGVAFSMLQFFLSHYLNAWTTSDLRATVLSFRGVALNLAYGTAGLAFAALTASLRSESPDADANTIFAAALTWLPGIFLLAGAAVAGFAWKSLRAGLVSGAPTASHP